MGKYVIPNRTSLLWRNEVIKILREKIKCREYNACKNACLECDILFDKKCNLVFNFKIPKKYVRIERRDCNFSWDECPTCRNSIGYKPGVKDFKCNRCGQKILWK